MKSKRKVSRRIAITFPAGVVKDVDWLAELEEMSRDELILEAVKRFLKPHLEIRKRVLRARKGKTYGPFDTVEEMIASLRKQLKQQESLKFTKAISEATDKFKTGRYEP